MLRKRPSSSDSHLGVHTCRKTCSAVYSRAFRHIWRTRRRPPSWSDSVLARAEALLGDTPVLTGMAKEVRFESVSVGQLDANDRAGDVVLALSTCGNSLSVIAGTL